MTVSRPEELFDLTGKVAVITGGGGDIGSVYGQALAQVGASVVLADLDQAKADAAAKVLIDQGHAAVGMQLDITDPASAAAMASAVTEQFGGIDILVNNAALMTEIPRASLLDLPLDWFERVLRVNVMGAVVCSKAVVGSMLQRGGGRIINGSSAGAFIPGGIYSVSKLALHSVTVNLATELAPQGINVNAIAPGLIDSDSGYRAMAKDDPLRDVFSTMVPGKTCGPPSDLVGVLLVLCSRAGDWINGQIITVDGGWVTRL